MRIWITIAVIILVLVLIVVPMALAETQHQEGLPDVWAEAIGTANVRSGPSQEFEIIGEIQAGTEYRVLKQHEFAQWLLVEIPNLPTRAAWVFQDLIQIKRGNLATVPFESEFFELPVVGTAAPVAVNPQQTLVSTQADPVTADEAMDNVQPVITSSAPTLPPAENLVFARLQGRTNIRFGPGTDYPVIQTLDAGALMTVLATHSNFPWIKVGIEGSPNGEGWVLRDIVEIQGNLGALPVISDLALPFPTPSATPPVVLSGVSPFSEFGNVANNTLAAQLGNPMYNFMLSQNLVPRTDQEGSLFVLDLETGEHFVVNDAVAYSGMSMIKIPIVLRYFIQRTTPLDTQAAETIANTLICSENITTNQILAFIGEGNIMEGTARVTDMMAELDLGNTYVSAPLWTGNPDATPAPEAAPITTNVDQTRTQPDLYNQITVQDIGWLLGSLYQCGMNGTGPLIDHFGELITEIECRQMMRAMMGNKIGALIENGTPQGTVIAHKHGWIRDTHGDAGIVFGPDKDYVLVMTYHEYIPNDSAQLEAGKTFPVLEELAREAWSYFNPSQPMPTTVQKVGLETCNIYGEPVISDMLSGNITLP